MTGARRGEAQRRPAFWMPAVLGALFILAGAWWISTPLLHHGYVDDRAPFTAPAEAGIGR